VTISGIVLELSPTDKVPGIYMKTLYGVGDTIIPTVDRYLLVVGLPSSAGLITPDTQVVDITSTDDSGEWFGPGSEGDRMCRAALKVKGIKIKAATAAISGATAAAATITIDGTWTLPGTWNYRIGGLPLIQGVLATDTPATVAAAIVAYIAARPEFPVSAASAAGSGTTYVVTLTMKSTGARGNDTILVQDTTGLPSGMTSAIAGGAAVANGGKRFHLGAGVEDVTNLLATIFPDRYHRIAIAQRDSQNLVRWRNQLDAKAGPLEGRMEHAVFGTSASFSAATSLAQTSLDNQRAQLCWMLDSETQPSEWTAEMAAYRLQREQVNPNNNYDQLQLTSAAPQTAKSAVPIRTQLVAALDVGITPLNTQNGNVFVVRAITTRSLTAAGAPDDGTVDVGEAATPDEVRDVFAAFWQTQFSVNHPYLRNNPTAEEPTPDPGVAYPDLWTAEATRILKEVEALNWVTEVDQNPVKSTMHPTAKRIVFFAPIVVMPIQHQLEGTIAQTKFKAA
jgi:phage tail sheath gpL-like